MAGYGLTTVWDEKKLARLQKKLGPAVIVPPVGRMIGEMSDIALEAAKDKAPRETGALVGSILKDVTPMAARIHTAMPYAKVMEGGRKPEIAGGKMPPPDALRGIAIPGTEFALARSIMQRGIKGRFYMRKARGKIQRELPRLATRLAGQIAEEYAKP